MFKGRWTSNVYTTSPPHQFLSSVSVLLVVEATKALETTTTVLGDDREATKWEANQQTWQSLFSFSLIIDYCHCRSVTLLLTQLLTLIVFQLLQYQLLPVLVLSNKSAVTNSYWIADPATLQQTKRQRLLSSLQLRKQSIKPKEVSV